MKFDRHACYARYYAISDDELIRMRHKGGLIPEAEAVLLEVMRERSIEVDSVPASESLALDFSGQRSHQSSVDGCLVMPMSSQAAIDQEMQLKMSGPNVRLAPRHLLWWIYGVLLVLGYANGIRFYAINECKALSSFDCPYVIANFLGSSSRAFGLAIIFFLIFFHAMGLYCYYCFLRQKPSFSRGFWILFVLFYAGKFGLGTIVLIASYGGDPHMSMYLENIVFYLPLYVATVLYAFGSAPIWRQHRGI